MLDRLHRLSWISLYCYKYRYTLYCYRYIPLSPTLRQKGILKYSKFRYMTPFRSYQPTSLMLREYINIVLTLYCVSHCSSLANAISSPDTPGHSRHCSITYRIGLQHCHLWVFAMPADSEAIHGMSLIKNTWKKRRRKNKGNEKEKQND